VTEFNISNNVFKYNDNLERIDNFSEMVEWLEENVGPKTEQNGLTNEIVCKGLGWEIQTRKHDKTSDHPSLNKFKVISWYTVIDDDYKAMLFALKWVK
jgi:hypothetical protein